MTIDAPRRPRARQFTDSGVALAAALLPLAVGVLMAKATAADPLTPVNALITSAGERARVSPAELCRCGRSALRGRRAARNEVHRRRPVARLRRPLSRRRPGG
ncbi:hypothetical protein ACFXOS_20210 [Streptomyces sp. NPDC059175]|uniref:hypothetical protein n=1 Tax=Streptomyces sp. NPDC059175 TaxID=3346757 RepID=UPI00367CF327